jgi:nucleotide-binding universal stress UspA family protein
MSYKTILVHVDESRHAAVRVRLAAAIAEHDDAHLVGAATTGASRYIYQGGMPEAGAIDMTQPLAAHLAMLREHARAALSRFDEQARGLAVRSFESALIDDETGAGICLRAHYSDLTVIGQFDPDQRSPVIMSDFPEYVVLNAGRPVLIVPYAGKQESVGRHALVAWDGSVGATRAVANALPLLKRAEAVDVVVFNAAETPDAHGEQPGADIALYLARHGVKVEVRRRDTERDIGNALLSMTADLGADLLVMGGYGHSRFREILLGGVTHTVLEAMTLPVLMSN